MAEHDDAGLGPDVEMPDPHLLVDETDQPLHIGQTRLRHLHVEGASQVQRLDLVHPGERHLVIGPAAGNDETDLVLAGPFERPVVAGSHMLDDIERTATIIMRGFDEGHAVSTLPKGWNARHSPLLNTHSN